MRVNEREIVRIGIIKLRSAKRLCKRMCERGSGGAVTYPQNSPYNPHFAQQSAQLSFNLILCSTQYVTIMLIILIKVYIYAIVFHKVLKLVPSLKTALTINNINLKLLQLFSYICKEYIVKHLVFKTLIVLNAFILKYFSL